MSARKLYIGIDAAGGVSDDLMRRSGLEKTEQNALGMHITTQYCGKEVTDADADTIAQIWTEVLRGAKFNALYELNVRVTGQFDLYGPPEAKDNLVVLCEVDSKFSVIVGDACKAVCEALPYIEESSSRFSFSPHITLGKATVLPELDGPPLQSAFDFDKLTMWGDNGEVRGTIVVPVE